MRMRGSKKSGWRRVRGGGRAGAKEERRCLVTQHTKDDSEEE